MEELDVAGRLYDRNDLADNYFSLSYCYIKLESFLKAQKIILNYLKIYKKDLNHNNLLDKISKAVSVASKLDSFSQCKDEYKEYFEIINKEILDENRIKIYNEIKNALK